MAERIPNPEAEPARPETKSAFADRIITITRDAREGFHGRERAYTIGKTMYVFVYNPNAPRGKRPRAQDRIAVFGILETTAPEMVKDIRYILRRDGYLEQLTAMTDVSTKPHGEDGEQFLIDLFKAINREEKTQREMGTTLVTEKELQDINTLIDQVMSDTTKREEYA